LIPVARRNSRFMPGLRVFPLFIVAGACLCLALAAPVLRAQTFDASTLREPADLDSPWLIQAGDDLTYARPDFDDSQWKQFDPHGSIKNVFQTSPPEVVWYRLHVKVSPDQIGLALREWNISRAFEIYVNGERLMVSGKVAPYVPYTSGARLIARIPDRLLSSGSVVIALRVHISPVEWGNVQNPGYYASNLTIGQERTLDREDWLAVIGENSVDWLDRVLSVCLGLVALVLFAAQRRNTEYLWLAAAGLITLAELPQPVVSAFTNIPLYWQVITTLPLLAAPYVLAAFLFSFVHQRITWRWSIFFILAGIMNAFSGLQGILFTSTAASRRPGFRHPAHRAGHSLAARKPRSRHSAHSPHSLESLHLRRDWAWHTVSDPRLAQFCAPRIESHRSLPCRPFCHFAEQCFGNVVHALAGRHHASPFDQNQQAPGDIGGRTGRSARGAAGSCAGTG